MIIGWLDDAVDDLQSLRSYIAQDNVIAAKKVVKKILHSIEILSEQPGIGRVGRVPSTRELIVSGTPYIIPYRVQNNIIEILRVFHCAMQWPENI
jgi:toxin ParE1/3/4